MSHARDVLEIARWEVLRFFRWRDVVLSLAIMAVVLGATWGFAVWQKRSASTVEIATISPLALLSTHRLRVSPRAAEAEPELRAAVARGELDGLLVVRPPAAVLVVRKEPPWLGELSAQLTAAVHARRLADIGVTADQIAQALGPVELDLQLTEGSHRGSARTTAIILLIVLLTILFFGMSYLFLSITGEKQQRAAEQLFTMTSPRALIDGKLLGATAMAAIGVVQAAGIGLVTWNAFSAASLSRMLAAFGGVGAGDLAILVFFTLAGCAFWMAAAAALFATISDPNSSARSSALMLPGLPLSAAFFGIGSPDSSMMQVLGLVPITSMTVVPARVVLGEPSLAHVLASAALLVFATWFLRRAAARIYETGMLMYGKEPGLREMLRWLRAPRRGTLRS